MCYEWLLLFHITMGYIRKTSISISSTIIQQIEPVSMLQARYRPITFWQSFVNVLMDSLPAIVVGVTLFLARSRFPLCVWRLIPASGRLQLVSGLSPSPIHQIPDYSTQSRHSRSRPPVTNGDRVRGPRATTSLCANKCKNVINVERVNGAMISKVSPRGSTCGFL